MTTNYVTNPLTQMALAPTTTQQSTGNGSKSGTWFEAMARAWGEALDKQAATIQEQSDQLSNNGTDTPAAITELTAQSLKMGFLSNSSHSAIQSVGDALSTMARKG
jgi:FMN phosphatase YigB (HAD superfamily)